MSGDSERHFIMLSPVWQEAHVKWEKVSMVMWTHANRPNSGIHRWVGWSLRGLTPTTGEGRCMMQWGQCLTICQASSLVIENTFGRVVSLTRNWACISVACCTGVCTRAETSRSALWLPSPQGPGNWLWEWICSMKKRKALLCTKDCNLAEMK